MNAKLLWCGVVSILCLSSVCPRVGVAAEKATLWSFLGIPQAYQHVHGAMANRFGLHPGLEKKPPVVPLADPANLESDVPVIKKAAEIKQAEDLKRQKIKAIRYLTQIGCGCYDTDGSVTEAILAASDDCTEEVRLTTVESIAEAADGACCQHCGATCCCNKKIVLRLAEMAYERDDSGCPLEPSARVREAAARALHICCPSTAPVVVEEPEVTPEPAPPRETVDEVEDIERDAPPSPPDAEPNASLNPQRVWVSDSPQDADVQFSSLRKTNYQGVIVHADSGIRLTHVHLDEEGVTLPVGTTLSVYREEAGRAQYQGKLVVVQTFPGSVNARPARDTSMADFQPGCFVTW